MFRTELPIAPASDQLPRTARVLTMGSCFADSIGSRLVANKVDTLVNPFGTVFQPLALTRMLRAAAGEEVDWQQHLVEARGRWQSYDLHGSIGANSPVDLLQTIQEVVRQTGEFLRSADVVLLTLGTAWAYRLRETGELVNNCHKQPTDLFVRELLTPDEIINELAETHAYLRRSNPNLRFVLTVSPVRHLKDTLPLNAVSKSVLRVATHIVSDLLPDVAYFPAYELLLDDLRDYRFYAADMLHPSEVAEDYIWDKFARTYFDVDFGRFRKEWAAVRQSLRHRPLHPGAPEHRQFLSDTLEKLEQLSLRKVEVAAELNEVRAKIAALPVPRQPELEVLPKDDDELVDIDQSLTVTTAEATAWPTVELPQLDEGRLARLSPEEFRSQRAARPSRPKRGRRDGRGQDQPEVAGENEPSRTVALADDQPGDASPIITTELPMAAQPLVEQSGEPTAFIGASSPGLEATNSEEPAKKKKRRSRGGAKRTARKNALRLATGEAATPDADLPQDAASAPPVVAEELASATEETTEAQLGEPSSPAISAPAPTKQGSRRNKQGRGPRVELYASKPDVPTDEQTLEPAKAELSPSESTIPAEEPSTIASDAPAIEPGSVASKRNKSQGRRDVVPANAVKNPAATSRYDVTELSAPPTSKEEPLPDAGTSEPTGSATTSRNKPKKQPATPTVPAPVATKPIPAVSEPAIPETGPPPAARRSNRAKRVVSGGRAEKPAVDIPVVPVPDESSLRTQVAAGRMKGTSASLIEFTAEPATKPKKAAAPKQPAKPAAPKKATKKKPANSAPAPEPAAPEAQPSVAEVSTPAAKRKPAATKSKAVAKPAAAKPKPPRKPAKPD